MGFDLPGAAYDRYMGRYSSRLAPLFADFAGVAPGMRALDVGCGPGALSAELATRLGARNVTGVEPAEGFVRAYHARFPEANILRGAAEQLPFATHTFDAALAQLVLSFVADAGRVASEMRRVVREGGTVAACMWHEGASMQMSDLFWQAASKLDPKLRNAEAAMPFRRTGAISELLRSAGLSDVQETLLEVRATYQDFDDLWQPMLRAAGPLGTFMDKLAEDKREIVREALRDLLGRPERPFELLARACAARGRA